MKGRGSGNFAGQERFPTAVELLLPRLARQIYTISLPTGCREDLEGIGIEPHILCRNRCQQFLIPKCFHPHPSPVRHISYRVCSVLPSFLSQISHIPHIPSSFSLSLRAVFCLACRLFLGPPCLQSHISHRPFSIPSISCQNYSIALSPFPIPCLSYPIV